MTQGAPFMEGCSDTLPLPHPLQRKVRLHCLLIAPCSNVVRTPQHRIHPLTCHPLCLTEGPSGLVQRLHLHVRQLLSWTQHCVPFFNTHYANKFPFAASFSPKRSAAAALCYPHTLTHDAAGRPLVLTPECSFRSVCHMQLMKLSELWCGTFTDVVCCPEDSPLLSPCPLTWAQVSA